MILASVSAADQMASSCGTRRHGILSMSSGTCDGGERREQGEAGQVRTVDVSRAMRPRMNNVATVKVCGRAAGKVAVAFSN
jgi:hypothetical protein